MKQSILKPFILSQLHGQCQEAGEKGGKGKGKDSGKAGKIEKAPVAGSLPDVWLRHAQTWFENM